jgi:hypothetical protein
MDLMVEERFDTASLSGAPDEYDWVWTAKVKARLSPDETIRVAQLKFAQRELEKMEAILPLKIQKIEREMQVHALYCQIEDEMRRE